MKRLLQPPAAQGMRHAPAATAGPDPKSIAVLPFTNMSADKEQEYFSDGIAEELLNMLAQLPTLRVAARTSSFFFKGQQVELREIARKLNVAHLLEGSVRKAGNRVRITAQLIHAADGYHLWSQTWDRTLEDIFAVQDEIAGAVVAQLKVTLLGGAAPKKKAFDPEAYSLFLQARQLARQDTPEGYEQAVALNKQALEIDPSLAAAWVALASCYFLQVANDLRPNEEGGRMGREAIARALAIDPDLAMAHAALGLQALFFENDAASAARHYEHAIALEPTNVDILTDATTVARGLGLLELSAQLARYVAAHDPVNPLGHARLCGAYLRLGRLDEAIQSGRTALRLSPGRSQTHYQIALALIRKGDPKAALAELQLEPSESWRMDGFAMAHHALGEREKSDAALNELIRKSEKEAAWNIAYVCAFRGEADRAFEWLDKAIAYRDPGVGDTPWTSQLESIRSDPRWLPFLRRIRKAPEQLAAIKFDVKLPAN